MGEGEAVGVRPLALVGALPAPVTARAQLGAGSPRLRDAGSALARLALRQGVCRAAVAAAWGKRASSRPGTAAGPRGRVRWEPEAC